MLYLHRWQLRLHCLVWCLTDISCFLQNTGFKNVCMWNLCWVFSALSTVCSSSPTSPGERLRKRAVKCGIKSTWWPFTLLWRWPLRVFDSLLHFHKENQGNIRQALRASIYKINSFNCLILSQSLVLLLLPCFLVYIVSLLSHLPLGNSPFNTPTLWTVANSLRKWPQRWFLSASAMKGWRWVWWLDSGTDGHWERHMWEVSVEAFSHKHVLKLLLCKTNNYLCCLNHKQSAKER